MTWHSFADFLSGCSMKRSEIISSLPLQMSLYFNVYFAPFWLLSHICGLCVKYDKLDVTYRVILVTIHIVMVCIEITRLYLGYAGNLGEKIPELSGFWITTLILQLPITSFLLFHTDILSLSLERAVDIVQISFLIFQVFAGYVAVKRIANYQVAKFQQRLIASRILMNKENIAEKTM